MASDIQDELSGIFEALAGSAAGGAIGALGGMAPDSAASSVLGTVLQAAASPQANAASSVLGSVLQAVTQSAGTASSGSSSSGGIGSTLESVGMDVLKSGFGVLPIIGSLLGLFGGGGSDPAPALMKYQMPDPVDYQGAEVGGQIDNIDYSQSGTPRAFGAGGGGRSDATTPGITVNVQAMDARSFLDRSSDIAAAVKDAMLNLNSINDVVNDL
jgi:hypothetical protein